MFLPSWTSLWMAVLNLFGIFETPEYDFIVIGAGAGGCPLAQTLAAQTTASSSASYTVLLVERGRERPATSQTINQADQAILEDCAERWFSKNGVVVATGNCMGGATSINQGIYIEETADWILRQFGDEVQQNFTSSEIEAAFEWVRERVAPEPTSEASASSKETYINDLINNYQNREDFVMDNTDPGRPGIPEKEGVWRTHSLFDSTTGIRRSADTLLDRDNPNLVIRTETEVRQILFDGDFGIPLAAWQSQSSAGTPRARCVQFTSLEVVCVKEHGRIFLATGAFHTPEILIKSGIGPGGYRFSNSQVGENLSDKPGILLLSNFVKTFDYTDQITISNIAATKVNNTPSMLLFEEGSFGIPALTNILAFERNFVPTRARQSFFAELFIGLVGFCKAPSNFFLFRAVQGIICSDSTALAENKCDRSAAAMIALVAESSSKGKVTVGPFGRLNIDVNYLHTAIDLEAMGAGSRTAFELLQSVSDQSARQAPCEKNQSEECLSTSCPDLLARFAGTVKAGLSLFDPIATRQIPDAPASVVFPNFLEQALEISDNNNVGEFLKNHIVSPHHFAGTASMGNVVDASFKVIGVDGLYVADASVIPTTCRVNTMATAMMIGRLAAIKTINELAGR